MVKYLPAPESAALDATFAALADPTRRALLEQLAHGATPVSALAAPHAISLPAVSKHLAVLEHAGLVRREKSGRVVYCRLHAAPLQAADEWLNRYQVFWRERLDALAHYLDQAAEELPWTLPPKPSRSGSRATTRIRGKKCSAPGSTRRR
ncbi:MAG: metalloregulator ArsR/SmtB family transcription factor [Sinobacteraceae bacterium]|nr:metalloregulator ArsR/SmtB family transcription factor [Nevskiaceae bacterium]